MTLLEDFINVNKDAGKNSIDSLKKNWIILFLGIVYGILSKVIYGAILFVFRGPLAIIAGFIVSIVSAAMISNYLYMLYNVINNSKITINEFKRGFTVFLYKVYGIMFILFMLRIFLKITGLSKFYNIIMILAVILLNALPETIYQKHYNPETSITYTYEFGKENILNWYGSNIIILILIYVLKKSFLDMNVTPNMFNVLSIINMGIILTYALISTLMVYRGHLYKILSTSTKRKREFMSKY